MKFGHRRGGKCHRTLLRLREGPAGLDTLILAVGVRGAAAKKYWRLLVQLGIEGLVIRKESGSYRITPEGEAALEMLEADGAPNVRIFQPAEVAA